MSDSDSMHPSARTSSDDDSWRPFMPASPRTIWRNNKEAELSTAHPEETITERDDRLQELEWVRSGMTQVQLNVRRSYRKAERSGVGKPLSRCVDGGVAPEDEGWQVIEDDGQGRKTIDLVFIQDATGSMGSYIASATRNIETICSTIVSHEKMERADDLRVGIVAYRDHPGQDSSYVTRTLPFTSNTDELHTFLSNLHAGGGGDGPEAVIAGMAVALGELQWRRNAAKMIVIVTDAPPHGIGERGDGFSEGEPGGWDGLILARNMAARGISCFVVACEPNLSTYDRGVEYYQAICTITSGIMLPLMSADLLTSAIIGSVLENMEMEQLVREVGEEIYTRMGGKVDDESIDAMARELQNALSMQGRVTKKIQVANIYNETPAFLENVRTWVHGENTQTAKGSIQKITGDRFTEEYRQFKNNSRKFGYDLYKPTLPVRRKASSPVKDTIASSFAPTSPPVRKIIHGKTTLVPTGLEDSDGSMDSDSDRESSKPTPTAFKTYDGGARRFSSGKTIGSLPSDVRSKSAFTGLRGGKSKSAMDSDDDDEDDGLANVTPADDGESKPDTLAFTNDSISLDQAKRIAVQSIWRMRK